MRNQIRLAAVPALLRNLVTVSLAIMALGTAGCSGERGPDDGVVFNEIILPTDTLLNLRCADVGLAGETCVLIDPENPYANVAITEFSIVGDSANKFELLAGIPPGPTGAKARFYLWATALARFPSGENQYYTALALHELFDANSDPLIQEQALRAYRSQLENFFGTVTAFLCCSSVSPDGEPLALPLSLNELTADNLYRTAATGFERLVTGDPVLVENLLFSWGFRYRPATPPNFDDGLVTIIAGP